MRGAAGRRSRDDAGPGSLLSSATWKAGNICPSLNCAELLDHVLGADLWRLPRRQQWASSSKYGTIGRAGVADSQARARNRDGGQTMAADSGRLELAGPLHPLRGPHGRVPAGLINK